MVRIGVVPVVSVMAGSGLTWNQEEVADFIEPKRCGAYHPTDLGLWRPVNHQTRSLAVLEEIEKAVKGLLNEAA